MHGRCDTWCRCYGADAWPGAALHGQGRIKTGVFPKSLRRNSGTKKIPVFLERSNKLTGII